MTTDKKAVDAASKDLEIVLARVRNSNGNFPKRFQRALDDMLSVELKQSIL